MHRLLHVVPIVGVLALAGLATPAASAGASPAPLGYVLAARDGGVFAFGRAFHGSAVVGIAS